MTNVLDTTENRTVTRVTLRQSMVGCLDVFVTINTEVLTSNLDVWFEANPMSKEDVISWFKNLELGKMYTPMDLSPGLRTENWQPKVEMFLQDRNCSSLCIPLVTAFEQRNGDKVNLFEKVVFLGLSGIIASDNGNQFLCHVKVVDVNGDQQDWWLPWF